MRGEICGQTPGDLQTAEIQRFTEPAEKRPVLSRFFIKNYPGGYPCEKGLRGGGLRWAASEDVDAVVLLHLVHDEGALDGAHAVDVAEF